MIPNQYALRRRMMSGGGGKNGAMLAPASGITYTNGLVGLTAAEVSAMAALISNEPTITKDTLSSIYVDYGDIHRKLDIANQVTLSLNGTNYAFDIIGFNHNTLTTATAYGETTATGKAGITLQMHDVYATEHTMNDSQTNYNGWRDSDMRNSTMQTFKSYLPSAWQSIIKPVDNIAGWGAGTTTNVHTGISDSCFLLAEVEVYGYTTYSAPGEGSQYAYYKDGNSKIKYNGTSAERWWLRSPRTDHETHFCLIAVTAVPSYAGAHYSRGVSFAFCV